MSDLDVGRFRGPLPRLPRVESEMKTIHRQSMASVVALSLSALAMTLRSPHWDAMPGTNTIGVFRTDSAWRRCLVPIGSLIRGYYHGITTLARAPITAVTTSQVWQRSLLMGAFAPSVSR